MRKLLLGLLLCAGVAHAETWVMPNQGGGEITLSDQTCKADGGKYTALKHAYSWTNQIYFEGCWLIQDGNVHIIWVHDDGSRNRRVYPVGAFSKKSSNNGYRY